MCPEVTTADRKAREQVLDKLVQLLIEVKNDPQYAIRPVPSATAQCFCRECQSNDRTENCMDWQKYLKEHDAQVVKFEREQVLKEVIRQINSGEICEGSIESLRSAQEEQG